MSDKDILLEELDNLDLDKNERNISFRELLTLFTVFATILALLVPKIYLRNGIYLMSRDLTQLYSMHASLKEENSQIKIKLQQLKFKSELANSTQ